MLLAFVPILKKLALAPELREFLTYVLFLKPGLRKLRQRKLVSSQLVHALGNIRITVLPETKADKLMKKQNSEN